MSLAIAFPNIDPIIFELGPFVLRWYALAYIGGLLIGWRYVRRLGRIGPQPLTIEQMDDFVVWATLGVIVGGRIGYVIVYNGSHFVDHPLAVLALWQGGMSFHGGLVGVIVAMALFARKRGLRFWPFADVIACATPVGLFLGRLANFINGELFGRATDVPWGVVFPRGGPDPRHPSQLYEAGLEGIVLFVLLALLWRQEKVRRHEGWIAGAFLAGYGAARLFVEMFRQPDIQLGFLLGGTTMGQLLSLPMVLVGLVIIYRARPHEETRA